ncbi:unnamed protein product [Cunninghamella blakesleeana]
MYIKNWDNFQKAAEDIYISSPDRTRYVHQFLGVDGELVLKIAQYKTNQATNLKKFINLNTVLMSQMQNRSIEPENPTTEQPITSTVDSPQISETTTSTPAKSKGKKNKKKKGSK